MHVTLQPTLENDRAILRPLQTGDFEALYALASDPRVWEQHPNPNRWQRSVFQNFLDGAMESKGAFTIIDKPTGRTAGSSRYYEHDPAAQSIKIGYTFYGTDFWGTGINPTVKATMLDHAFTFVDTVFFEIGINNLRSQIAIGRLGAQPIAEKQVIYPGEATYLNRIYQIKKEEWSKQL